MVGWCSVEMAGSWRGDDGPELTHLLGDRCPLEDLRTRASAIRCGYFGKAQAYAEQVKYLTLRHEDRVTRAVSANMRWS